MRECVVKLFLVLQIIVILVHLESELIERQNADLQFLVIKVPYKYVFLRFSPEKASISCAYCVCGVLISPISYYSTMKVRNRTKGQG